jgi:nucleoside-diphosphate-sugar epimerase
MPRCLIIGCGYLGEAMVVSLLARGYEVMATTRGGAGRAERLKDLGATPVLFDSRVPVPLPTSDAVISAMAVDRTSGQTMRDVHVDGLRGAANAIPDKNVDWFHVSSTSVYGQEHGEWVNEDSPCEPTDASGHIVLEAEKTLKSMIPQANILRFAGIYGPERLMRTSALMAGEPLKGDPERWLNLIHRDDGAEVVAALVAGNQQGLLLNVSDNQPIHRGDFYLEMARLLGAPTPRWVPRAPGEPWGPHERNNRRIDSSRMLGLVNGMLRYRDYRSGLPGCLTVCG